MDILDEVLNEPHRYLGGKKGFNQSDIIAAKRLMERGCTVDEIARSVGVRIDIVQRFVDHYENPVEKVAATDTESPAPTVTKKKSKKKKAKKA